MLSDGYHDVAPGKVAMVVTYLETRAPHFLDAPEPDGLTFAPLHPDVADYLDLFDRVGAPWLWFGRRLMPRDTLTAVLQNPDIHIYTLLKNGRAEALLELDFREAGACELAYFGLTPALIGSGAGAYLMDRAMALAFERPIDRFHVHTCTIDSPNALAFYQRRGFVPVMQKIEIADDPRITLGYDRGLAPHVPIIGP